MSASPGSPTAGDLPERLSAFGVVPVVGARGYAEIAALVTGTAPKTIRNALSANPDLRARWQSLAPGEEACTHRIRHANLRYAVAAKLTPAGEALLAELGCAVERVDWGEEGGCGRPWS